jgi:hypothetical protein
LPAFFCRGCELESLSSSRTGGATPKTFMVNLFYSMLENSHLQLCVLLCTVGQNQGNSEESLTMNEIISLNY